MNATYAILSAGGVIKAWGYDTNGELGNGAGGASTSPIVVTALSGLTDLAIGDAHTVALKWDGTVWAWGDNTESQIGDGTTLQRLTPVQVRTSTAPTYLTSVIAVAGGAQHTLALKSDGTVWAWGDNDEGQIGDGTITNRSLSTQVKTGPSAFLSGVVALAAGDHHSLALRYDGSVYSWGSDDTGQLGLANGLRQDQAYATQVANLGDVVAIAGGGSHPSPCSRTALSTPGVTAPRASSAMVSAGTVTIRTSSPRCRASRPRRGRASPRRRARRTRCS